MTNYETDIRYLKVDFPLHANNVDLTVLLRGGIIMSAKKGGVYMQSVDRALSIMQLLAAVGTSDGLSLTEISDRLGLNQSTCHHLLSTLKVRRFVGQDEQTRRYRLGIKAVEVGQAAMQQVDLVRIALPHMEKLMEAVQENINLVVMDTDSVVYVAQVPCDRTVRMFTKIGERAPLHCTGVGKVLLADLPKAQRDEILSRIELPRFTAATICDRELLEQELVQVSQQGYAMDEEEREEEVTCMAAPVRDYSKEVVAALSISAPSSRLDEERQQELLPLLMATSDKVSRDLGYHK
ncbi:MAG TPA: IclR family transcriptional regulator [Firmicutes bacterium]|jgi:DNA-binding IclR family transcriptional regulator|nr:IclR family transcriptional regulator [Bacillota bacterium]